MGIIQGYIRVRKTEIDSLSFIENYEDKRLILKGKEESIDIDKTWQFLLYLLTGEEHGTEHFITKLFYAGNSTIKITEEEYDYTYEGEDVKRIEEIEMKINLNTSYLTPIEVKEIYNYLQSVCIEELFDNCDFDEVRRKNIYPGDWDISRGHKEYVVENYNKLNHFLERSVMAKNYIIVESG